MPDTADIAPDGYDYGEAFTDWRPERRPWQLQVTATLNTARRQRGATIPRLAHRARFAEPHLAGILTGRESPTLNEVVRLCAALGIRLEPPAVDRLPV